MFIENDQGQVQLLLANHDCCRPVSPKFPFTTDLVFFRGDVAWMEVMQRRYYLYPIHTSKTFLDTTSLAARLYLILLKLLRRDYIGAVKLSKVVAMDVLFTTEEKWVFGLIQNRTEGDQHPDAHACRLRLLLAVHLFSDNEISWETHLECDRYLSKLPQISADCRLTEDEELDVLSLSKQGTPRIKNRLRLLAARRKVLQGGSSGGSFIDDNVSVGAGGAGEKDVVTVEGGNPRVGGQPWWKLGSYSGQHVESRTRSTTSFLQYKDPESSVTHVLQDAEMLNLIWKDELLSDDENGGNRQLGLLFCYKLAVGDLSVLLGGDDCTRSFVDIMTRWFHLKLCRWGRESVNAGEEEVEPSRDMMKLFVVLDHPERRWGPPPRDGGSQRMLERGVELHGRMIRSQQAQMLKIFLQFWEQEFVQTLKSDEYTASCEQHRGQMQVIKNHPLSLKRDIFSDKVVELVDRRTTPVVISSFNCSTRTLAAAIETGEASSSSSSSAVVPVRLTSDELAQYATMPLSEINIDDFVTFVENSSSNFQFQRC